MSTTEETNTIDEKKNEETEFKPDYKAFAKNYLSSIILSIGFTVFFIGTIGLYYTKIAQSNILPDDIDLAPYTLIDRVVQDIPIDANIMRQSFWSENKDTVSQKIYFNSREYLDSFNKSFLCSIRKNADPNSGMFANAPLFFSTVYDNIVAKNFLAINTIFFYLSYLPESIIMLLYGIFGIVIWISLYFFNVCISIFYHFINIPQLFREVPEESNKWEAHDNISFLRIGKLLMFFFLGIPLGFISTFLMPIFFTLYGLITPLYASYKIQKSQKSSGLIDFIKDTFAYKKMFFFILATLSLASNALTYLGTNSIIGVIIAIAFAYFMGLYANEIPEPSFDGFTSKIRQNMKQATVQSSSQNLVEICKPIPVVGDESNAEKSYRELTKPKSVGGDIDEITPQEIIPVNQQQQQQDETQLQPITTQTQMGGKKIKYKSINKQKYNIRLV